MNGWLSKMREMVEGYGQAIKVLFGLLKGESNRDEFKK